MSSLYPTMEVQHGRSVFWDAMIWPCCVVELGQLERRMAPSQLIKQVYASNTIIVNTHVANLLAIPTIHNYPQWSHV